MRKPFCTTDTSPEADVVQLELLRQMSPNERLRRARADGAECSQKEQAIGCDEQQAVGYSG